MQKMESLPALDGEKRPGGPWRMDRDMPLQAYYPLDTHIHRICLLMGLTKQKDRGMRMALEITDSFKKIEPKDPVRYDFAFTSLGIKADADLETFLKE